MLVIDQDKLTLLSLLFETSSDAFLRGFILATASVVIGSKELVDAWERTRSNVDKMGLQCSYGAFPRKRRLLETLNGLVNVVN